MKIAQAGACGIAIAVIALMATTTGRGQSAPWQLVEHEVATGLRGGYHVTAADINNDKRVDLLAVATGAEGRPGLVRESVVDAAT